MIAWIVVAIAAAGALIVLGFAAYELSWKLRRFKRDLDGLKQVRSQLEDVQGQLGDLSARAQSLQTARTKG